MSSKPNTGTDKLWEDLTKLDSDDVCARTISRFADGNYEVDFMNGVYCLNPEKRTIISPVNHPAFGGGLELLLLAYLVDGKGIELGGKWISEKQVPGGSLFFTGPHEMPLAPLAERYGSDSAGLVEAGRGLGGTILEFGDASVAFMALPRIPVAFVLWEEDDEFPAEVTVMFDETIHLHIPVDVILGLVGAVAKFLVK